MPTTELTWNGLVRDDPVKVLHQRGSFRFISVRLDDNGEPLWVTVIGGTAGHSKWRHFYPNMVVPIKKKREKLA